MATRSVLRRCTTCHQWYPESDFHKNGDPGDPRQRDSQCRGCVLDKRFKKKVRAFMREMNKFMAEASKS